LPVPVLDNGDPGPEKRLLVFVHGFCSDAETWDPLIALLRNDPQAAQFEIACFDYKTAIMALPVINRLPGIDEIANWLDSWLSNLLFDKAKGTARYIDVTLVGHSMGGLVIQKLLTKMLSAERGSEFQYIRQAIFFATPHLGSMTIEGIRGFLGKVVENPQEKILRGLNQQVAELHQQMEHRVLRATRRELTRYPLPCTTYWGTEDNIVPETSARGFFPVALSLPGNHFSVHCPTNATYQEFASALAHPHGHSAIFEIELFRYSAKVKPLPPGTRRQVQHGRTTRVVESDNEAMVVREVTFGQNNNCVNDFELKYRTRNAGFIEPTLIPAVEMRPDHRSRYEESGTEVNYLTSPSACKKYTLNMKVLRGFEAGHRDYHQHFTNQCYFRRVRFELDLTEYLKAGWKVTDQPKLYYHFDDTDDHTLCSRRDWCTPDPATGVHEPGKWKWELEHIRYGVLDIKWDVAL